MPRFNNRKEPIDRCCLDREFGSEQVLRKNRGLMYLGCEEGIAIREDSSTVAYDQGVRFRNALRCFFVTHLVKQHVA